MFAQKETAAKQTRTAKPIRIVRYAACAVALVAAFSIGQMAHAQNKALAFGFGGGTTDFTGSGAAFANISGGVVLMPAIAVLTADLNATEALTFAVSADANFQIPRSSAYVGLGGQAGEPSSPYISGGATLPVGDGFLQFRARLWPNFAYVGLVLGIPF